MSTDIYADGGWRKGRAGAAWAIDPTRLGVLAEPLPSSAHAELLAVVAGLEATDGDVRVHSDCNLFTGQTAEVVLTRIRRDRFIQRRPAIKTLCDRFAAATTGRSVLFEHTPSKGPDAVPQLQAADALERFARQWATLHGLPVVALTAEDLNVTSLDQDGARTAIDAYCTLRGGPLGLGTSAANDILRDLGR